MEKTPIIALPKGRLYPSVQKVFESHNYKVPAADTRTYYHPKFLDDSSIYLAKPKAVPELLFSGQAIYGITGFDIIQDFAYSGEFVELHDFGFNKVKMCLCSPFTMDELMSFKEPIIVATEFTNIASAYFTKKCRTHYILNTFGSTEGYINLGAHCIIDVVETGETLRANNMNILDVLFETSTRLFTTKAHANDPLPKCLYDIITPKQIYMEGNDGTGKTYAISKLKPIIDNAIFHDRCVLSDMTLDPRIFTDKENEIFDDYKNRLDKNGIYFILDDTIENCQKHIQERGDSLNERFHTKEDLKKFQTIYIRLFELLKNNGYNTYYIHKSDSPEEIYLDIIKYLINK